MKLTITTNDASETKVTGVTQPSPEGPIENNEPADEKDSAKKKGGK